MNIACSNRWETIASVIIVIAIIAIILIAFIKIIEYDNELNFQYDKINYLTLLENNTNKIVQKIDTSLLWEWNIFYLYKTGSEIKIFTGIENQEYKYINYLGEYVNSGSYKWAIYTRQCWVKKDSLEGQIIECSLREMIRK